MSWLKMFDKLDDIIYKPVEAICEWTKEPLKTRQRKWDADQNQKKMNHELAMAQLEADIEKDKQLLSQQLSDAERKSITEDIEARERIAADVRRWNAEIDAMINNQEDDRRDRLVESIKRYQIELSQAAIDIQENLGLMSLELREKANNMVFESTKKYYEFQRKAEQDAMQRLKDIDKDFSDNERVRLRMEDSVMNNMDAIINKANTLITEIAEDFKTLNNNADILLKEGMETAGAFVKPMAEGLGVKVDLAINDTKKLNG